MALCFRNELPKRNPKESLMDRSVVVENFIRREGKRERGVIFPLYLFHTVSYVCLFWIQFLRIPSFLVQYPLFPIILPINLSHSDALPIWFQNDSNFQHCLVWGKNHSEHWIDLTTPAHPRTIRESLSQSNSMATTSRQHRQEWQCQRGWKIQQALSLSMYRE